MIEYNKIQGILENIESIGFDDPRYEEMTKHKQRIKIKRGYISMDRIDKLSGLCHSNNLEFDLCAYEGKIIINIWEIEK